MGWLSSLGRLAILFGNKCPRVGRWGSKVGKITGIGLELYVDNWPPSDTEDALYLGVYGSSGGREFPLDVQGYEEFQPGEDVKLNIGGLCHWQANQNPHIVTASTGGAANDPAIDNIDLDSVEFVYLRKNLGSAQGLDDELKLSRADVWLCDGSKERYFSKSVRMFFGYEYGAKHWLVGRSAGDHPVVKRCHAKVVLSSIQYGGANVGKQITFVSDVKGVQSQGQDWGFKNGSTISPGLVVYDGVLGPCTPNPGLSVTSTIHEGGVGVKNSGTGSTSVSVTCPGTQTFSVTVNVDKKGSKKDAVFVFTYTVTATCV